MVALEAKLRKLARPAEQCDTTHERARSQAQAEQGNDYRGLFPTVFSLFTALLLLCFH